MIIGLVPGAMKPYHAGHHYLVERALVECDEVIIFTTLKDRKEISGLKMKAVWEKIIIPNLPSNVKVEFVVSPIGSVFQLIEWENIACTNAEYRIYGGSEDSSRFSSKYINDRWPFSGKRFTNVANEASSMYLRGIGSSPMAKGEWVRNAIQVEDLDKFRSLLPEFLQPYSRKYFKYLI